jgi:hypothetical protein
MGITYGSLRVLLAAPLGIDVEVDEDQQKVWVLRVWRLGRYG